MIVAPLMTPILGTALALVLADRRHLLRNVGLVLAGAVVVVVIGYLVGHPMRSTSSPPRTPRSPAASPRWSTSSPPSRRASGRRRPGPSDVSDTLPGVAIAISLVPPLAVVG